MSKPYEFYIGDTFNASLLYKPDRVNPADVTDIGIECSIKDSYGHRSDLVVTKDLDQVVNPGRFTVESVNTTTLKPGKGFLDIKYNVVGRTVHTSKFIFVIAGVITP